MAPESPNMLLPLHKKRLANYFDARLPLHNICISCRKASVLADAASSRTHGWARALGLDFHPSLSPGLETPSTTVRGGHHLMYPLNYAGTSAANGAADGFLGRLVHGTAPLFFPIPFLCVSLSSLHLGPSSWTNPQCQHIIQVSLPALQNPHHHPCLVPLLPIAHPLPPSSETFRVQGFIWVINRC